MKTRCIKFKRTSPITGKEVVGYVYAFSRAFVGIGAVHKIVVSTNGVIYDFNECELLPEYKYHDNEELPKHNFIIP